MGCGASSDVAALKTDLASRPNGPHGSDPASITSARSMMTPSPAGFSQALSVNPPEGSPSKTRNLPLISSNNTFVAPSEAADSGLSWKEKLSKNACSELKLGRWKGKKAAPCPLDLTFITNHLSTGKPTAILTLFLGKNDISDADAKLLASAISKNCSLTRLGLDFNSIGPVGTSALAKATMTNSTLTYLDLSNNKIGDEGAAALALVVSRPQSALTILSLNACEITGEGGRSLAKAVETLVPNDSKLESLSLSRNKIGLEACDLLADAVEATTRIIHFFALQTGMSLQASIRIKRALRRNTTMNELLPHKLTFLSGLLPRNGGKPNASSLFSILAADPLYDPVVLSTIWKFMHS
mmetsp:Transcript_44859/g.87959  ORF Transcript_44859/g.87959 Transcript_44859/m.87959 type:complete len:355 (-) Transcript_44859:132-1196(-)|eukprot:CAMPEP_0175133026 /NCGR_PEP_ID=MMETSP0087-20121206/7408_1 /TAXON_ID=136419 /ORGANISM="Unknown Unknown, Strain D1" /LENGTH=354 /DNA_ID=CAMNT_0016415459 /DNA_START=28 /DNA_END=1095 /DNA_ORIENTATION=-